MGIIFILVTFIYGVLYLRSRGLDGDRRKGIFGFFDGISLEILYIAARINKRIIPGGRAGPARLGSNKNEVMSTLSKLSPGEKKELLYRNYLVGKISLSLLVVYVGTLLAAGMHLTGGSKDTLKNGTIQRQDFNGEATQFLLDAQTDEGDWQVGFTLNPKRLTEEEIEEILPGFYEKLGKALAGKNRSLDEVTDDLNLVRGVDGYPFSVEWSSSDTGLVGSGSGKVTEVEEPCDTVMTARIKYGGQEYVHEFKIKLVPRKYSEEESFIKGLQKLINETERESISREEFVLPDSFDGKTIRWSESVKDYSLYVFAAVILIAVVIFKMSDRDLNTKLEEKKKKLKRSYPEILHKLTLYIGAGMTVRAAFQKVSAGGDPKSDPVYEEMNFSCREMRSGISEAESYFRFGRRCGLQEYIRLSTLLGQNLKRGSSNLLERLREEAENASEQRIQSCKKAGEEAVTKLLLPMVMMLMVVMVMILLPAFSNMNL